MPTLDSLLLAGAIAIAVTTAATTATPALARDDEQVWLNLTAMGPISGNLLYFGEIQGRGGAGDDQIGQLIMRPAVGWRFDDRFTVYGGYARVLTETINRQDNAENRIYQQLSWNFGTTVIGELSSRTRLEQRFRSDGSDTGWRVRQMLRTVAPVQSGPRPVKALVSFEVFAALNDTDWGARGGFDQLRSFVGVEIPIQGKSTIEAGYLNQAIVPPNNDLRMNHALSIALFLRR